MGYVAAFRILHISFPSITNFNNLLLIFCDKVASKVHVIAKCLRVRLIIVWAQMALVRSQFEVVLVCLCMYLCVAVPDRNQTLFLCIFQPRHHV